jgi:hypothetical protein
MQKISFCSSPCVKMSGLRIGHYVPYGSGLGSSISKKFWIRIPDPATDSNTQNATYTYLKYALCKFNHVKLLRYCTSVILEKKSEYATKRLIKEQF